MTVLGLDHINLRVAPDELEGLREFYLRVVGLTDGPRPDFGTRGYWLYAGTQPVLHLSVTRDGAQLPGKDGQMDHLAFACRDLAASLEHLAQQGTAYQIRPLAAAGLTQLFLHDSVGNKVELQFHECPAM